MERVADPTVVAALLSIVATTRNKLAAIGTPHVSPYIEMDCKTDPLHRVYPMIHFSILRPFSALWPILFILAEAPRQFLSAYNLRRLPVITYRAI